MVIIFATPMRNALLLYSYVDIFLLIIFYTTNNNNKPET